MFDYINFTMPCPKCGAALTNWQSKSAGCTMDNLNPMAVGYFYGGCDDCRVGISFDRDVPHEPPRAEPYTQQEVVAMGFKMTVDSNDGDQ